MLQGRQPTLVSETLRASLAAAAANLSDEGAAKAFDEAAALLSPYATDGRPPHPALPVVGAEVTRVLSVTQDDTATAMGHPDPAVAVLGSPRIALWFEIVASDLLPPPTAELSHVGVGIVVHHLDAAQVGEKVTVRAAAEGATGRRITFACTAMVGTRLVALGAHHRVLRERRRS